MTDVKKIDFFLLHRAAPYGGNPVCVGGPHRGRRETETRSASP